MSFKYFRPTLRKVNTTQKAPAFKNTSSAEHFADQIDAADILTNHSVEKHLAEVNFDDHGHFILKESGLTRGHSILENSFSEKLSGRNSILAGEGKQNESQFGEDGARAAGAFGKGMAGDAIDDQVDALANTLFAVGSAVAGAVASVNKKAGGAISGGVLAARAGWELGKSLRGWFGEDDNKPQQRGFPQDEQKDPKAEPENVQCEDDEEEVWNGDGSGSGSESDPDWDEGGITCEKKEENNDPGQKPVNNSGRPAPDDNGGGEGGFMTWKLQEQLSNDLKNAKDPITNPNGDDLGGGYLSDADLIEMESALRNAKDPATNWGDDTYNNFMGAIEMNIGEISLKAPATNWGDDYTSTTANVVDTLFPVQNDF